MDRIKLLSILKNAQKFLHSQDFIPILQHFCFDDDTVLAYNDEQAIEYKFKSGIRNSLPGNLLIKLLSTLESDIEFKVSKDKILVKSNNSEIKLPSLDKSEYIFNFPELENKKGFVLSSEILSGLQKCLSTSSSSGLQKVGITCNLNKNSLIFYATDNATISKYETTVNNEDNLEFNLIIPVLFCETLISLYQEYKKVTLYFDYSSAVVTLDDDCRLFTRLYDSSNALNFENAIKESVPNLKNVLFSETPIGWEKALNRAILVYKSDESTLFNVAGTKLKMNTQSSLGKADDLLSIAFDFGSFSFKADPTLIVKALKVCDKVSYQPNILIFKDNTDNLLHLISLTSFN